MGLYQKFKRLIGKVTFGYDMLKNEDKILVAVSGGEDSLVLLYFLNEWRRLFNLKYKLFAVHLDMNFPRNEEAYQQELKWLKNFVETMGIPFIYEKTDCGTQAIEVAEKGITNPCFVCSWHRRKRLFKLAEKEKANKIALGHHMDDMIVTLFLNMFYHGEISTILPVQELFKGKLYLIRPMVLIEKGMIKRFVAQKGWKIMGKHCPFSDKTRRKFMEDFLEKNVYSLGEKVKKSILNAIFNVKIEYMPEKKW